MTARYQIVYFEPDPFSGARVPIGALVESRRGVQLITGYLPGSRCLGGDQAVAVVRLALDALRRNQKLGERSMALGPQVDFAAARPVPEGVSDPAAWVADHVLPQRPPKEGASDRAPAVAPRQQAGYRFFETWHVAQWVKKKYRPKPQADWDRTDLLPDVSHYVAGASRLLLMEPLVTTREAFESDLEQVNQTFLAWRGLENYVQLPQDPMLVTYVHGGSVDRVREARGALRQVDRVFDVTEPGDRGEFLRLIEEVGATGPDAPRIQ